MAVRPARVDDVAQIAEVHVRSWQGAYRGLIPQDYLDGLDPAAGVERRTRILRELDWSCAGQLVVGDEAGILGFADLGPARDADDGSADVGEIYAIYLHPDAWGRGHGRELMAASLGYLAQAGYRQATLWVLGTNARARRFYEAAGFSADGAIKDDDRGDFVLTEVRYRRPLP
jgi:ribosomal protein S18 acetylase RimI-like enzyme